MTIQFYKSLIENLNRKNLEILVKKNKDYANPDNIYALFEEVANRVGTTVEQVILVFIETKLNRIHNLQKNNEQALNEAMEDSILDARNYLDLLYAYKLKNTTNEALLKEQGFSDDFIQSALQIEEELMNRKNVNKHHSSIGNCAQHDRDSQELDTYIPTDKFPVQRLYEL